MRTSWRDLFRPRKWRRSKTTTTAISEAPATAPMLAPALASVVKPGEEVGLGIVVDEATGGIFVDVSTKVFFAREAVVDELDCVGDMELTS